MHGTGIDWTSFYVHKVVSVPSILLFATNIKCLQHEKLTRNLRGSRIALVEDQWRVRTQ